MLRNTELNLSVTNPVPVGEENMIDKMGDISEIVIAKFKVNMT